MSTEPRHIVLASRASQLAQVQTRIVLSALQRAFPDRAFGTSFMSTQGDKDLSRALYLLGGKSLWTKELEVALLAGEVDMLVHSLKDVPTALPEGCALGAILEREHGEDSLVVKSGYSVGDGGGGPVRSLDDLPDGAVIGTSSVRRVAQLKRRYPGLVFKDVTRFAKLDDPDGPYAALILAKAGLLRLGFDDRVTCDVVAPTLFHAVGQGALAVEIRADDAEARRLCSALTHWPTSWRCLAERACLRVLEGGCSVPVGVHSELVPRALLCRRQRWHRDYHRGGWESSCRTGNRARGEQPGAGGGARGPGSQGSSRGWRKGILNEVAKDREQRAAGEATGSVVQNVGVAAAR
ncbi:porphobilinogen deaminase, dipyromethane cofactor binding domain-containing protein [Russula brevipes]|nr:porphobilinogen deaminase, dipyromethane cofactor binding domain-containing protein [Russula brevipes]